jgi:hypothetical protein
MKGSHSSISLVDVVATRQQISARGDPAIAGEPLVKSVDVFHPEGMAEMVLPALYPALYLEGPDRAYSLFYLFPGVRYAHPWLSFVVAFATCRT